METENRHTDPEIRERILALAGELFPQYGVKSVSMDEIARQLGMSKRTLYEYFGDKEELLIACLDRHHDQMQQWAEEIGHRAETVLHMILELYRETIPKMRRTSPKFHEDIRKYPKAMARMTEQQACAYRQTLEFFRHGVSQTIFLPELNYELLSQALTRMIDEPLSGDLLRRYTIADFYSSMVLTLVRGACTEKGLQIFEDYLAEYQRINTDSPKI